MQTANDGGAATPLNGAGYRSVRCDCGFELFDGLVLRSRVLKVEQDGRCVAKCRCKRWKRVPLRYG